VSGVGGIRISVRINTASAMKRTTASSGEIEEGSLFASQKEHGIVERLQMGNGLEEKGEGVS